MLKHDFKKSIHILLSIVPKEDLYGLRKISLVSESQSKKFPNARGLYDGFNDPNNRVIFLCMRNILPKRRALVTIFPLIVRGRIGYVLFHELGHHYHHMHHGIKKEERESFANNYRSKYFGKWLHTSKLFKMMCIFVIVFRPVIRLFVRRNSAKKNRHCPNHSE